MTKKLAYAAATAAVLFSVVPAFAWGSHGVTINNDAFVKNVVTTTANTGDNTIHGFKVNGGAVLTGDATAVAGVENLVNGTNVDSQSWQKVRVDNDATVKNYVTTDANSGSNSIGGFKVNGGAVLTGAAGAQSVVSNVVNTNMVSTGFSF